MSYVADAISTGRISGDGQFTESCANFLEQQFHIPKVLMTPSCTASLEMAAMLCDLQPGDEVILPSFTFVSTASAFLRENAKLVFVDIRPDTLNIDETKIAEAISDRSKAIVAVHYAGVSCEMDTIMKLAKRHNLIVVEDAAQAVNAHYRDRALGSIGHLGCYSFHDTKNYVCGEGGALCVNDERFIRRAEILRDKGTNRKEYFRGEVDKYTWVDIGSSYVPSEIACAFLRGQFDALEEINRRRQKVSTIYRQLLSPLAAQGGLTLPTLAPECRTNNHLFYILLPTRSQRDRLLNHLRASGIGAAFHYVPLHSSAVGKRVSPESGSLPNTDSLSARLIRLPLFVELTEDDQREVVASIGEFLASDNR